MWYYETNADNSARYILGEDGIRPLVCVGVNPSNTRKNIRKLMGKDLIAITGGQKNRTITLTEKGLSEVKKIYNNVKKSLKLINSNFQMTVIQTQNF